MDAVEVKLPKWQSHKVVAADKIVATEEAKQLSGNSYIYGQWELSCGVIINVSNELENRVPDGVDPIGGYYVQYADGFVSWSPAKAFEKGYTRLED